MVWSSVTFFLLISTWWNIFIDWTFACPMTWLFTTKTYILGLRSTNVLLFIVIIYIVMTSFILVLMIITFVLLFLDFFPRFSPSWSSPLSLFVSFWTLSWWIISLSKRWWFKIIFIFVWKQLIPYGFLRTIVDLFWTLSFIKTFLCHFDSYLTIIDVYPIHLLYCILGGIRFIK